MCRGNDCPARLSGRFMENNETRQVNIMLTRGSTIIGLLAAGQADDIALAAPARAPLSYDALRALAEETVATLNRFGIGREDRVAIVLPNGPEMASAFVTVAAGASAAPLNLAYRAEEFEFYLSDLRAKALIVEQGSASPAVAVAEKRNIGVLELVSEGESAGGFRLQTRQSMSGECRAGFAGSEDVALILHTSGTTSRPKIVPLTQRNVCASACNVRDTLALSSRDRGLNIMPLFHIHGLIAGLLAPLAAGGGIFCTPGFNALKFFAWMSEARPTWYTAVPTMHQTIVSRAANNRDVIAANPLRFIRSSSSSLPPQVIRELEAAFNAPVIESYGMTEASHQMTSNPLPPATRIPGSVGIAAGPEVAIMDESGNILPFESTGEIVIRGANVTSGYENNPKANTEAFAHGWFRTGDQGLMTAAGYLTITGRLKEIINRGGEKVSPREVDEVLMDHPAVQQVVTFPMPHDKLGEDVAAAVVLREGQGATERELRDFVGLRLADFKVPRKIVFLEEIPKGATGKLQRIGLAAKLGLVGRQ
jgi:oxalate---CoA ligase